MKKYLLLSFCFILLINGVCADTPASRLLQLMPASVNDLTQISDQTAVNNQNHEFVRRTYISASSKPWGSVFIAHPGYSLILHIWYMLTEPEPDTSTLGSSLTEKMQKKYGQDVVPSTISSYPVAVLFPPGDYLNGKVIIETQKGKYYVSAWCHYQNEQTRVYTKDGAKTYCESAIAGVLAKIPTSSPSPSPSAQPAPIAAKPGRPYQQVPQKSAAQLAREEKAQEDRAELEKMRAEWSRLEKKIAYKYSEEGRKAEFEKYQQRAAVEERRQSEAGEMAQMESLTAVMLGQIAEDLPPVSEAKKVICGGIEFFYHPEVFEKRAKPGETYEVGRWENNSFVGYEAHKRPVVYLGQYYVPVAYLKGKEITGYLWINAGGEIVKDPMVNRALFTYLYVLGFAPFDQIKRDRAEYLADAEKCDEEIASYADYKAAAKTLKLASSAMSVYLGAISGGMADIVVSVGLSSADAAIFLVKMNQLENPEQDIPDLSRYSPLVETASNLSTLSDLNTAIQAAREVKQLNDQLITLKSVSEIKKTKAAMDSARASLLQTATSLGWSLFDSAEDTGQIAEQAAALSLQYTELKYLDMVMVKILKDAQEGIASETEATNIFLLPYLKARQAQLKGELLFTMLDSYRQRKTAISGYIGRLALYVKGQSVDENQAQQAIWDSEKLIELELDQYFDNKINIDVATELTEQRARF